MLGTAMAQFSAQMLSSYPVADYASTNDFVLLNQKSGTGFLLKRLPVAIVSRPTDTTNFLSFDGNTAGFGGVLTNSATGGSVTLTNGGVVFGQRAGFNGTNFWQFSDDGSVKLFLHLDAGGSATWSSDTPPTPGGYPDYVLSGSSESALNQTFVYSPTATALAGWGAMVVWVSQDSTFHLEATSNGEGGGAWVVLTSDASVVYYVGDLSNGGYDLSAVYETHGGTLTTEVPVLTPQ